jgi:hypothetical protein
LSIVSFRSDSDEESSSNDCEFILTGSEDIECFLEYITFDKNRNVEQMINSRKQNPISEDIFNYILFDTIKTSLSLEQLKNLCYDYQMKKE